MHKVYTTFKITAFDRNAIKNKWSAYVFMFHKLDHISALHVYYLGTSFLVVFIYMCNEFAYLDARSVASAESKI